MDENKISQAGEYISKLSLSRLEKAALAYRLARSVGDFDGLQPGFLAEIYAEEQLGMTKAVQGQKAYDGTLPNGRRLSVKSKKFQESQNGKKAKKGKYVRIAPKLWDEFDDLLVVFIDQQGALREVIGPFAFNKIREHGYHNERRRFKISSMREVAAASL
jgi:hypothetical protein